MPIDTTAEILGRRTVLRDLVALSTIPAAWVGREPPAVAAGLADTLIGLLELDFAFVRLSDPSGAGAVEVTRGSAWTGFPEWLEARLATRAPFPRKEMVPDAGDDGGQRRGFVVPIGVNGEGGVVAAACERADFPTPTDQVLLPLGANHAAAAFQNARLIHERKRAEEELRTARNELEVKVAERTAELHVANDELNALRRVATLAAEGVRPQDLFAVVAEEVARIVDVPLVSVTRYELDGTATGCASFSPKGPFLPVGERLSLEGTNVLQLVRASSEPARTDDYSKLEGGIADVGRRSGIRSTVGVPIVAAGGVWGAMVVSTTEPQPLPEGTEARLAEFTELLATAIENAESRQALERVAEEQAALQRVATLVAQGVRPSEIFSAVSEEVGHLFGTNTAGVIRFDHDSSTFVVVGVSKNIEGVIPIGTRWEPDDALASADVFRTGRSARLDAVDSSPVGGRVAPVGRRLSIASTVASPIIVEGRLWGTATVGAEEPLPPDAGERLEKFAELVATAISNAESKAELAASRRLAARSAETTPPPERSDLRFVLSRLATGLADAVTDLQELSRGIHPAILSEGGIGPALRTLARRSTIPVELDVTTNTRLPPPIEVAAYYVASEALANAVKHAQASRIEVSLAPRNGSVLLSIRDDGIGGADPLRGSGLVGLADRVEALGGSICFESRPGDGTHITAELPLELEAGQQA